eukprot:m.885347 g.885347  ORF g.885347 m.885347 type:complete len:145 (+) comp23618_c0_seq7:52-486(+)
MLYDVVTTLPKLESDDDTAEDTQTESATEHFSTLASALANLVKIDNLKQEMCATSARVTSPIAFTKEDSTRTAYLWRPRTNGDASAVPPTAIEIDLATKIHAAEAEGDEEQVCVRRGYAPCLAIWLHRRHPATNIVVTAEMYLV